MNKTKCFTASDVSDRKKNMPSQRKSFLTCRHREKSQNEKLNMVTKIETHFLYEQSKR